MMLICYIYANLLYMDQNVCPRCQGRQVVKSGVINERQRFQCKACKYFFTVNKLGKRIDSYYVVKALQLYMEGLSYREIERILGVSHVTVSAWVKAHKLVRPVQTQYHPTYKIFNHSELVDYLAQKNQLSGAGMIITELGDKFMLIKWERFKE